MDTKVSLTEYHRPHNLRNILYLFEDIGIMIFVGWMCCWKDNGWFSWLTAFVLIARTQMAMANLLHDESHGNISRTNNSIYRIILIVIIQWIRGLLFHDLRSYQHQHNNHHLHLLNMLDPDHGSHNPSALVYRRNVIIKSISTSLFTTLCQNICDWTTWKNTVFGGIGMLNNYEKINMVMSWLMVLVLFNIATSSLLSLEYCIFCIIWFLSRSTLVHITTTFREFCDHYMPNIPLQVNHNGSGFSIAQFTRTSPSFYQSPLLNWFIHPHDDNYHTLHHWDPKIPLSRLAEAHSYLKKHSIIYADSPFANSYSL